MSATAIHTTTIPGHLRAYPSGQELSPSGWQHAVQQADANGQRLVVEDAWRDEPRWVDLVQRTHHGQIGSLRTVTIAHSPSSRDFAGKETDFANVGWADEPLAAVLDLFVTPITRIHAHRPGDQIVTIHVTGATTAGHPAPAALIQLSSQTLPRQWIEIAGTAGSLVCDDFIAPRDPQRQRFWQHDALGISQEHRCPAGVTREEWWQQVASESVSQIQTREARRTRVVQLLSAVEMSLRSRLPIDMA